MNMLRYLIKFVVASNVNISWTWLSLKYSVCMGVLMLQTSLFMVILNVGKQTFSSCLLIKSEHYSFTAILSPSEMPPLSL